MLKEMSILTFFFIGIPIFIASIILFYVLWINGYLIKHRKTAVLYVGVFRQKGRGKIKFVSCNGYIKKVIKISESRNYKFNFHSNITSGIVTAEIQDISKKILLQVDENNPEAAINLDKNCRYYLVVRFKKASGEFNLTWN